MKTGDDESRHAYRIIMVAEPGTDESEQLRSLRHFLKRAWRTYRLRCTSIEPVRQTPSGSIQGEVGRHRTKTFGSFPAFLIWEWPSEL